MALAGGRAAESCTCMCVCADTHTHLFLLPGPPIPSRPMSHTPALTRAPHGPVLPPGCSPAPPSQHRIPPPRAQAPLPSPLVPSAPTTPVCTHPLNHGHSTREETVSGKNPNPTVSGQERGGGDGHRAISPAPRASAVPAWPLEAGVEGPPCQATALPWIL